MTHAAIRKLACATLATAFLASCQEGSTGLTAKPKETQSAALVGATTAPRARRQANGADVEAPDVYSNTDQALWDGRPSLGGIWVAAPDAVNPERVIIRNTANGKSVTGALFRRERENPGPPLQMSSDAAEALGLLAGQPAKVSVVALRRDEPVAEPEPEAPTETAVAAEGEAAAAKPIKAAPQVTTDVGSVASAAIDKAEGSPPAKAVPAAAAPSDTAQDAVEPAPPPAKKGFLAGLFKPRKPKADPGAPLSAISPNAAAVTPSAPAAKAAAAAVVETAPLDQAPTAAVSGTYRYAIGAFSVEANAKTAADALGKAGLTANVQPGKSGEKSIWAVYASGTGDKADLLAKIKKLGFKDAYLVK